MNTFRLAYTLIALLAAALLLPLTIDIVGSFTAQAGAWTDLAAKRDALWSLAVDGVKVGFGLCLLFIRKQIAPETVSPVATSPTVSVAAAPAPTPAHEAPASATHPLL